MVPVRRLLAALVLCVCLPAVAQTVPWHADLFLAEGDVWRLRIPVTLTNHAAGDLAGYGTVIPIGSGAGRLPMVGERADAVRVCNDAGVEMLFDLRDAAGERVATGPIPEGASLIVPATVPAGGSQRLWVYAAHPTAYRVPDFLNAARTLSNGGFEQGEGAVPAGWALKDMGPGQSIEWVADTVRSGKRAVRAVAAPGTAPTWMGLHQVGLAVAPGGRYRLTAWVKGEDVQGTAGWYVHVANPEHPQKINRVQGREGTFDWTPITIEFTAPEDALSLGHGSVLNGTGTVWYDDITIESLDEEVAGVQVAVGAPATLTVREIAAPAPTDGSELWHAPVRVINLGERLEGVLVQANARALLTQRLRRPGMELVRLVDPETAQAVPYTLAGDSLLFVADLPADTVKTYRAELGRVQDVAATPALDFAALVDHPSNLAVNPSFEAGGDLADDWPGAVEAAAAGGARFERFRGGPAGEWALRSVVPDDVERRWTGWRQRVPVEPNASYYFAAFARTENVTGGNVRVHAHLHNAAGETRFWSAGPDITGTTDWTVLGGRIPTAADTADVELHLTHNVNGTVEHDGVVFMRTLVGDVGALDFSPKPAAAVWAENPIVKVFPDTPPAPRPERLSLAAARSEEEPLQLCLWSAADAQATFEVSPLSNGERALPAPRIERVGYVPVLQPSGYHQSTAEAWERQITRGSGRTDGWTGWWPDYLAPTDGSVPVPAGQTQAVWLTWDVPADAAPGDYTGTVRVRGLGEPVELPVTFRVWSFAQPEQPTLQVIYDLRGGRGWSPLRTAADWEQWWRFMADKRISTDHVRPDPVIELVDGELRMDFTEYDKSASLLYDELKMSAGYFPRAFYATGWAHPPRPFLGLEYDTPEYARTYGEAVERFWAHLEEKGWSDRLSLYISDEPHYWEEGPVDWLGRVIDIIRAAEPEVPIYSSTWGNVPEWYGRLNHWGIAQYGRFPVDEIRGRQVAGDKLWFTTDGQMEIDTPYNACERMLPYYCQAYHVSGYEFWGLTWYTYNPYEFGWHSYIHQSSRPGESYWVRYPNGDGYLAYPGALIGADQPISTIRLEQAREGIEDYEIFQMLEPHAADPEVRAMLEEVKALAVIPNAAGYRSTQILPDPDALTALRRRAGDKLDELVRPR